MWDVRVKTPVDTPVGTFPVPGFPFLSPADHRIVEVVSSGRIYDPSYAIGPKPDVRGWAKTAIAAWAKLSDGHGHDVDITNCGSGPGQLQTCFLQVHIGNGL
jgi:hypothetical protein